MKILFLTNNTITESLIKWLRRKGEELVVWGKKLTETNIAYIRPDFIISYNYKYIIGKDVIVLFPQRIINLHISYLPWNKGADPNIWSFFDNSPKGVTIHVIDDGLDTGDILCQKRMYFREKDETFRSTYLNLHKEIQSMFKKSWPNIRTQSCRSYRQFGEGTFHWTRDLSVVKEKLGESLYDLKIADAKSKIHGLI